MKNRFKRAEAFNSVLHNHYKINGDEYRVNDLEFLINNPWLSIRKGGLRDGRKADKFLLKREKLPQDLG